MVLQLPLVLSLIFLFFLFTLVLFFSFSFSVQFIVVFFIFKLKLLLVTKVVISKVIKFNYFVQGMKIKNVITKRHTVFGLICFVLLFNNLAFTSSSRCGDPK